jgi:DNA polymerase-3 subunit chi
MPTVDFYILYTDSREEKNILVGQITHKAWQQDYRIHIHTQSPAQARIIDKLLWTFQEDSFLPHDIYPEVPESMAPIQIGYTHQIGDNKGVLINLTEQIPPFCEQFQRIVEIVDDIPSARETGRTRYRSYKNQGYELKTHDIHRYYKHNN